MPKVGSWVKIQGAWVHLYGSVKFHACSSCGEIADFQCDWKVPGGTCDRWICGDCRLQVGEGKDLCEEHAGVWQLHPNYRPYTQPEQGQLL